MRGAAVSSVSLIARGGALVPVRALPAARSGHSGVPRRTHRAVRYASSGHGTSRNDPTWPGAMACLKGARHDGVAPRGRRDPPLAPVRGYPLAVRPAAGTRPTIPWTQTTRGPGGTGADGRAARRSPDLGRPKTVTAVSDDEEDGRAAAGGPDTPDKRRARHGPRPRDGAHTSAGRDRARPRHAATTTTHRVRPVFDGGEGGPDAVPATPWPPRRPRLGDARNLRE